MPQPLSSSMSMLVHRRPLAAVQQVLDRRVGRDGHGGAEHDLPHVHAQLGVGVDVLDHLARGRGPAFARLPAVAMELQVGEVRPPAGQGLHARQRGGRVARHAEVIAVDMDRVREPERVGGVGERLQDRARGHCPAGDGIVETGDVSLPALPRLDPTRIHDLHRIAAGGAEEPGGIVPHAVALAALDLAEQVLVVPHEHEDPAVHAGRVVQLRVAVPREQGCHCRVERGGVAQARVAVTGGEGRRDGTAAARAGVALQQGRRRHGIRRVLIGDEATGVIAARAGEVRVDVHSAGHHDHTGGIERPHAGRERSDDAPVLDADVAQLAVHPVGRVVDRAADDPKPVGAHRARPRTARSSSSRDSPAACGCASTEVSGSGTSSMR